MGNRSVIKYSSQSFGVSATKGVLFYVDIKIMSFSSDQNISNMSTIILITVMFNFFKFLTKLGLIYLLFWEGHKNFII